MERKTGIQARSKKSRLALSVPVRVADIPREGQSAPPTSRPVRSCVSGPSEVGRYLRDNTNPWCVYPSSVSLPEVKDFGGKQPMKRHLMRMLIGTSVLVGGLISDVGSGAAQAQHYGGHRGSHGGHGRHRGGHGRHRGGHGGYHGGHGRHWGGHGGHRGGHGRHWGGHGGYGGGDGGRGGYGGCDGGLGQFIPPDLDPDQD